MGRLLPAGFGRAVTDDATPRVIGIEGDDADDLLAAMSSGTARQLLAALHDEPAAPSELVDRVGTSLQNVQYHLGKLEAAGVVEVVETVYSEKGREMKVYGPADRPLVVVAGGADETATLRTALTTLLSGLAVVGLLSIVVQRLAGGSSVDAGGGGVSMSVERSATPVAGSSGIGPNAFIGLLSEPGVLFFFGGLAAVVVGLAVWAAVRG